MFVYGAPLGGSPFVCPPPAAPPIAARARRTWCTPGTAGPKHHLPRHRKARRRHGQGAGGRLRDGAGRDRDRAEDVGAPQHQHRGPANRAGQVPCHHDGETGHVAREVRVLKLTVLCCAGVHASTHERALLPRPARMRPPPPGVHASRDVVLLLPPLRRLVVAIENSTSITAAAASAGGGAGNSECACIPYVSMSTPERLLHMHACMRTAAR